MVIKRIGPMSLAKMYAVMCAVMGLFLGAIFALASMAGAAIGSASSGSSSSPFGMMAGIGFAAVLVFPIMYGAIGFVAGLIGAAIYNLVAGIAGGIEIDIT
jgi:hypothetical protein